MFCRKRVYHIFTVNGGIVGGGGAEMILVDFEESDQGVVVPGDNGFVDTFLQCVSI